MKCPNCNNEMKYTSKKQNYFSTFLEIDGDEYYYIHTYRCKDCKIKLIINDGDDIEEWAIPEKYHLTDKQINTIKMIDNWLGIDGKETVKTKNQGIKFISENLMECIKVKEMNRYCQWDY